MTKFQELSCQVMDENYAGVVIQFFYYLYLEFCVGNTHKISLQALIFFSLSKQVFGETLQYTIFKLCPCIFVHYPNFHTPFVCYSSIMTSLFLFLLFSKLTLNVRPTIHLSSIHPPIADYLFVVYLFSKNLIIYIPSPPLRVLGYILEFSLVMPYL